MMGAKLGRKRKYCNRTRPFFALMSINDDVNQFNISKQLLQYAYTDVKISACRYCRLAACLPLYFA